VYEDQIADLRDELKQANPWRDIAHREAERVKALEANIATQKQVIANCHERLAAKGVTEKEAAQAEHYAELIEAQAVLDLGVHEQIGIFLRTIAAKGKEAGA